MDNFGATSAISLPSIMIILHTAPARPPGYNLCAHSATGCAQETSVTFGSPARHSSARVTLVWSLQIRRNTRPDSPDSSGRRWIDLRPARLITRATHLCPARPKVSGKMMLTNQRRACARQTGKIARSAGIKSTTSAVHTKAVHQAHLSAR